MLLLIQLDLKVVLWRSRQRAETNFTAFARLSFLCFPRCSETFLGGSESWCFFMQESEFWYNAQLCLAKADFVSSCRLVLGLLHLHSMMLQFKACNGSCNGKHIRSRIRKLLFFFLDMFVKCIDAMSSSVHFVTKVLTCHKTSEKIQYFVAWTFLCCYW